MESNYEELQHLSQQGSYFMIGEKQLNMPLLRTDINMVDQEQMILQLRLILLNDSMDYDIEIEVWTAHMYGQELHNMSDSEECL